MTADKRLPIDEQRKYKHIFDGLIRVSKEEGVATLWTGMVPSACRAMLGNLTQLVSYVQAKHYILSKGYKDGLGCHIIASSFAGFIYAFSTTPLDVTKTRMQTMKTINGVPEYKNMRDVIFKTVKIEGFTALWKGFTPYFMRIAPNTILLFVFVEQLTKLYKIHILKNKDAKGGL